MPSGSACLLVINWYSTRESNSHQRFRRPRLLSVELMEYISVIHSLLFTMYFPPYYFFGVNGDSRGIRTHIFRIKSPMSLIPLDEGIILVLHTGFEPALNGTWIRFLYHIGIQECRYSDLGHKNDASVKCTVTPFLEIFDNNCVPHSDA